MGDSDGRIHPKRTVECVSGGDVGYIRLGYVRVIEEGAHDTGKEIVIARVLNSAL